MAYVEIDNSKGPFNTIKQGIKYGLYYRNNKRQELRFKSLCFSISLDICKEIGLEIGDRVNLNLDEENTSKWIINKSYDNRGFKVHLRTKSWMCFSVALSKFSVKNQQDIFNHFGSSCYTKYVNYIINDDKSISIEDMENCHDNDESMIVPVTMEKTGDDHSVDCNSCIN